MNPALAWSYARSIPLAPAVLPPALSSPISAMMRGRSATLVGPSRTLVLPAYVTIDTVSSGASKSSVCRSTCVTSGKRSAPCMLPETSTKNTRLAGLPWVVAACLPAMPTRNKVVSAPSGLGAAARLIEKGTSASGAAAG
jgi:hypothetical protein